MEQKELEKSELTSRQWKLYNLVKDYSLEGKYIKEYEIYLIMHDDYPYWNSSFGNFHDSNARSQISKDVQVINNSNIIQKWLLSNACGLKIATEEEYSRMIEKSLKSCLKRLKRLNHIYRKMSRDGQMRLDIDGVGRNYYEAFLKINDEQE